MNDDDLNDHLVWPQWCAVTVQVLNQLGERDHFTQTMRGGGDEEAHEDIELPLLGCRVLRSLLRARVPPTQAHTVPQRGLPQDQDSIKTLTSYM